MCNQNAKRGYPNDITKEFINDPKKFEKNAKEWCKKYANMNDYDNSNNFYS
jgi:ubiquitin-protein ligase